MKNILYYLKKFGHLSFDEFPLNEVDGLILSQVSYLNLDSIVPSIDGSAEAVSLLDVLDETNIKDVCYNTLDQKRNKRLIRALKNTQRYEGLRANYFSNEFQVDKVIQFCAVTFLFKNFLFTAYRGTDITLLGWKENLNMSFLEVIPSQEAAKKYLEKVASKTELPLYLAGHSKGGNLAIYAALFASSEIHNRILHIYNYDGPGFQTDIFQTEEYKRIEMKISNYTCKESMVGILLYHTENMFFVQSRGLNILQHDPYNWFIQKNGNLKFVDKTNIFSKTFGKTVDEFIRETPIEERKLFLEILFQIGMEKNSSTVLDWVRHPFKSVVGIRKRYRGLDRNQKLFFKTKIKQYRRLWNHNFKYFLKKKEKEPK